MVRAALGGEQPDCVRLVRNWRHYSIDPQVLAIGPRKASDTLRIPRQRSNSDGRNDLLELFGLGPGFALRLTAKAALATKSVPVLTAAMAGRLTPVAASWLGIDPSLVDAGLLDAGWYDLELTSTGRLRAGLPADWLAKVWAPGLALIGGRLVLVVDEVTWPTAQVIALERPGDDTLYKFGVRYRRGRWKKWPP
jgi:hypothetical protein